MSNTTEFATRLLEHLAVPTFVLDAQGCVLIWNKACERLTGVGAAQVLGTRAHWQAFYDQDRPCVADLVLQHRLDEIEAFYPDGEEIKRTEQGAHLESWCLMPQLRRRLYLAVDAVWVYDERGTMIAVVETLRDLTARKQAQLALQRLASTDGLTGLDNRRSFDTAFEIEWKRAQRQAEPLSLIMLDVDYFKRYNDHYGHQQGDACLCAVAGVLRQSVVRAGDLAARYGGEEFAVILPAVTASGAAVVAERLRLQVHGLCLPHQRSEVSDRVSVSVGVASVIPTAGNALDDLLAAADSALYAAKAAGRNRVRVDNQLVSAQPATSET